MRKKALRRRIDDIKARNALLDDLIKTLMDTVKPPHGNYAMFALRLHLTADEAASIEEFWKWADMQDRSMLDRQSLLQGFEDRVPTKLRGQLEDILSAHRKDQTAQFSFYADLVLGPPR